MAMEYYSFEKVLKELLIDEDELKRLVSEGEIRAFRDEDKMKFKKTDIDGLRKGRMTEPTIILPSGGSEGGSASDDEVLLVEEDTSETLLDIDDIGGGSSSTSVPTVDFGSSSDDSAAETLTEELVFDEKASVSKGSSASGTQMSGGESQDTFIDEDSGMTTEPLELLESSDEVASVQRSSGTVPAASAPRSAPRPMVAAPKQSHPLMAALLVFSAIISIYSGFLVYGLILESDNDMTGGVTDTAVQYFGAIPDFATKNPTQPKDNEKQDHIKWRKGRRASAKSK
ncbi:MAG: hypothetical protein AABZ60_25450 [Planctomycetota bacterium]